MRTWRFCFLFAAALTVSSCARRTEHQTASVVPANPNPAKRTQNAVFDHFSSGHARVACEDCHTRSLNDPVSTEPRRPMHSACSNCHSAENYLTASTSEPLCVTCHPAGGTLDAKLRTQVLPFPKQLRQFGANAAFSHRTHTDEAKMAAHKANYGCGFCHTRGDDLAPQTLPSHAECYSCHIHEAGQKFGRCENCHAPANQSISFNRGQGAAGKDYNFQHATHEKRKDGSLIACNTCHPLTASPPRMSDIALPVPARGQQHQSTCWGTCHIQKDETRCGKCHVQGLPAAVRTG